MHSLLAASGPGGIADDSLPFAQVDLSRPVKLPGLGDDAVDVFAVIFPQSLTGAEVFDAATVGVDHRAGQRVRALVKGVRHAVTVAVEELNQPG